MKKKLSTTKKVIISILIIFIILISLTVFAFNHLTSKIERVEIDRTVVTETGKEPAKEDEDVITIALFGTDFTQNEKYGNLYGASDATMILGIDTKNNRLKLFSLMRDLYLDLPDGSGKKQNLNYTMAYGGPELILKTINSNFNLTVDKFIYVSLHTLPTIIDKLGGVELNITSEELNYINNYITSIDKENGTITKKLTNTGLQTLNGTQASAYCRIRYTEGRDFKRTERQRDVLSALFQKFKTASISDLTIMMNEILPLVSTNLTNTEIISIVSKVLGMGVPQIEQSRFPLDGKSEMIATDMLHLTIDIDETTSDIHKFLYSLE
ncbi:LCP family protein [Clostridium sp.]|uniref:LCP family protein n=1 Tax=Clostridium sp. TaxID=1506 RepID=UPI0025BD664A|nr:LCP family protein [Clostridium sp.]MCI9070866.1 LytR family transcriptional regulator [Clostridium sp.]